MTGAIGEACQCRTQASVAGPSEGNPPGLARLSCDRREASICSKLVGGQVAGAILAHFGEDLTRAELACPWEAHENLAVLAGRGIVADACGQVEDAGDERCQNGDERADHFALRFGFGGASKAQGCCAQAGEKFVRAASATVALLSEEAGEAFHAQPRGTFGRRVALEVGKRDGAVDVGEDRGRPGPEAVEQGAQLVCELEAGSDEVITAGHKGAQGADCIGRRGERSKAMPVGAQQVGQQLGVAVIILRPRRAIARPRGLDRVRVDRHDRKTGRNQCIDDQP